MRFLKKIDITLLELITGIVLFGIVCQFGGMWFVHSISRYTIGLWIGIVLAIADAWHMWWSLNRNLTLNIDNESGARAFSTKSSVVRYAVILIAFLIICLTDFAYPLAAFLGLMGLKIGAYLQPLIKKIYEK